MADAPPQPPQSRDVDPAALARTRRRWAGQEEPPWLHAEVARRMAERLSLVRRTPEDLIDWWSSGAGSQALLRQAYPQAFVWRVESSAEAAFAQRAALRAAWWSRQRWRPRVEVLGSDEAPARPAQLLWANMTLHAVADPELQFRRWHGLLADDGFLMFSTLGPGTLRGLREVYARVGWPPPHAPFVDMHDLGDMLLHAGFADPVMDQEILTLTWVDAASMLDELRRLGSNAAPGRLPGWRTPRWRDRLFHELRALSGPDDRLRLDFEIVYGHAFKGVPRPRRSTTTEVPLDELRRQMRSRRSPPGAA